MPTVPPMQVIEKGSPWTNPLLRWAGSKRKLLPILMTLAPKQFGRYYEPFAGSACLFFALKPKDAVLGDINEVLINTYKVITAHPRLVSRQAQNIDVTEAEYYRIRSLLLTTSNPIEMAAQFVYINRYCFNGVYRTNSAGQFNVPIGSRTGALPSEAQFYRCSVALRNAVLTSCDFETCLSSARKGDFAYLDPPYATKEGPHTGEYGPLCFMIHDIERLITRLSDLDARGVRFLLSYADSPVLRDKLPERWHIHELSVYRHVSGFATFRGLVNEVLISNY